MYSVADKKRLTTDGRTDPLIDMGEPSKNSFLFFVRNGIHSVADYNSTLMGVVVVVVVVRIFTMG